MFSFDYTMNENYNCTELYRVKKEIVAYVARCASGEDIILSGPLVTYFFRIVVWFFIPSPPIIMHDL